jgi:hypothetical protein
MPLPTPPPPAQSSEDYEIWAFAFFGTVPGLNMFSQNVSSQYRWGTTDYEYNAIVPTVRIYSLDTSYNGHRLPGISDSGTDTYFDFDFFKEKIQTIPESRRAVDGYYWWPDVSIYSKAHENYYKNTSDGMTYDGDVLLSPWLETNAEDTANSLKAFLDRCVEENITFSYFIDDKEANDYFWLNGRNSFNYNWLPDSNGDGYPEDPRPNVPYAEKMSDARVISAIVTDPRFTSYVNPSSGLSLSDQFIENYKAITNNPGETRTAQQILAPFINITDPMDYVDQNSIWRPWGCAGGCGPEGNDVIQNGYDIWHNVIPAWNCAVDDLHFNDFLNKSYVQVFNEYPEFEDVVYCQYNVDPTDHEESFYFQGSNLQRYFQNPIEDTHTGSAIYYSGFNNVIFEGGNYPPSSGFSSSFSIRSGYVISPVNDEEAYNWSGYYTTQYKGPAGNSKLVRYPETNPYQNGIYSNYYASKFYDELCFKFLVNSVKRTRTALRSDTNLWQRFTPWIAPPSYPGAPFLRSDNGIAYWYEMIYHLCLGGTRFFHLFDSTYNVTYCSHVQRVLDEWRRISGNHKTRPCSSLTGNFGKVDRIVLWEAFEKLLISGGQLQGNGTYLWRLTPAPKYFNKKGVCLLKRVGNDSDLPEFIRIDSSSLENSRGVWIYRQVQTPPSYVPITTESLTRSNKNDIVKVFQPVENFVYKKENKVIIQQMSPNKLLVRL